jgi:hypothetical protein
MSQTELYTSLFRVALDRHALEMNAHVDLEGLLSDADLEVRFDCIARMFLVHMRAYAAAKNYRDQRKISIRVPASWWQHLKRDYAPEWFTRMVAGENEETHSPLHDQSYKPLPPCVHFVGPG